MLQSMVSLVLLNLLCVGVTWSFPSRPSCSPCKPGTFLIKSCSSSQDTQCKPCRIGTFTDTYNMATECNVCSPCALQTYEDEPCTYSKNTKCVTCSETPGKISKSYRTRCSKSFYEDPLEAMLGDDPGPGHGNGEIEEDGGAAQDQADADNPSPGGKLVQDEAPTSDNDRTKEGAPSSDDDITKEGAPASDDDITKEGAPASDDDITKEGAPASDDDINKEGVLVSGGDANKDGAPVSDGDVTKQEASVSNAVANKERDPASDGDVNKEGAPASDGDANKEEALESDGDVNKEGVHVSGGDINKEEAPASDGDVTKVNSLVSDGDASKEGGPVIDGDVNKEGAPVSDGDANKEEAPVSDSDVTKEGTPASDGDINKEEAPASNGDVNKEEAPASDGDAITSGDTTDNPSILDVHIDKDDKFVTDSQIDQTNSPAGEDRANQVETSELVVDKNKEEAGVLAKEVATETTQDFNPKTENEHNHNAQSSTDGSQVTSAAHVSDGDRPISETSTSSVRLDDGEVVDEEKEAGENLVEPIILLKTGSTRIEDTTEGFNNDGENATSVATVATGVSDESSALGGQSDVKEEDTDDDKKLNDGDENPDVGRLLDDSISNVTSESDNESTTISVDAAAVDGEPFRETTTLVTEDNTTHGAGLPTALFQGDLGNEHENLNSSSTSTPIVSGTSSITDEGDTPTTGQAMVTSNVTEDVLIDEPEGSVNESIQEVNIAPVMLGPEYDGVTQRSEANTTVPTTTSDIVVPDDDLGEFVTADFVDVTTKKSTERILTLEEAEAKAAAETMKETEEETELGPTTEEDKESVRVDSSHHKGEQDDGDSRRKTAIIVGVSVGGVAVFALAFFVSRKVCRKKGSFKVMKKVTRNGGNEEIEFQPVNQSDFEEEPIKASKATNGLYRQGPNVGPPSPRGKQNIYQEPVKEDDVYAVPDKKSHTSLETPTPLILSESPQEPLIKNLNNEERIKYIDDSTDDEGMSSVRERLLPLKSTSPNLSNVIEETPPQTPSVAQSPPSSPTSNKSENSAEETAKNKINGTSPLSVSISSQGSLTKDMMKVLQKTDQQNGDKNKGINKQGKVTNTDGDIEC